MTSEPSDAMVKIAFLLVNTSREPSGDQEGDSAKSLVSAPFVRVTGCPPAAGITAISDPELGAALHATKAILVPSGENRG